MSLQVPHHAPVAKTRTYVETFDDGPGGWAGWISNQEGFKHLACRDSCLVDESPWWIDYNHAPPGAGYLHLPFALDTRPPQSFRTRAKTFENRNRFIAGGFSRNLTDARVTLQIRGEIDLKGADLLFHIQANVDGKYVNHCLTGQPIRVTSDWSEQTLHLTPDPSMWTCLGTRLDRGDFYGIAPIDQVLADVNCNIILILFPLEVQPLTQHFCGRHDLRAGEDYEVDRSKLPQGSLMLDEIRIDYGK